MTRATDSDGFVAKSLSAHSLIGLVLGALIYQICLTGTLTVFAGELRQWEQPAAPLVCGVSPEGYATAVREGAALAGTGGPPVIILGPTSALPRLEVRIPGKEGGGYADSDGHIRVPVRTAWTDFITELHERLHLPGIWGIALVAVAGVALLAALISGIAAHPRIFRDAFRLRRGGDPRLEQADLHNRTGVWGLPFHVVVTLSGCFLALVPVLGPPLAFVAYGGDIDRAMKEMSGAASPASDRSTAMPDVASLIRKVERDHAPARVSFVLLESPGTPRQVLQIDTDVPRQLAIGESYRFDSNGNAIGAAGFADGPFDKQLHSAMFQLHFGSFGGVLVRILYGLLGLGLCWLVSTGIRVWLIRQCKLGHPVGLWSRLWSVVVWGQVAAMAIGSALSSTGIDPLYPYLAVTIATLFSGLPWRHSVNHKLALQALTAVALIASVAVKLSVSWPPSMAGAIVGLCALLLALLLLAAARKRKSAFLSN